MENKLGGECRGQDGKRGLVRKSGSIQERACVAWAGEGQDTGEEETDGGGILKADLVGLCGGVLERGKRKEWRGFLGLGPEQLGQW